MANRTTADGGISSESALDQWLDPAIHEFLALGTTPFFERPERVGIEITNACNLNCVMCNTHSSERAPQMMPVSRFARIIEEVARDFAPPFIELYTVGETFLHPELERLVELTYAQGIDVHLSTNAQFPKRVRALYERFTERPPKIFLSIDGATKETFEKIRLGGRFERAIETLETLYELNQREWVPKIPYYLRSILSMDNIHEVGDYFRVYGKYFEDTRNINFQMINGISPDKSYFENAVPFANLVHPKAPCHMPFRNLYYSVEGGMTVCARDYNNDLLIGTVDQGSHAVWHGERAEAVRGMHRQPESLTIEACRDCVDTYRIARSASNEFIHRFVERYPGRPAADLAHAVLDLLWALNDILPSQDEVAIRACVARAFAGLDAPPAGLLQ